MDIINWASTFSNVVFMTYEQINPDDGFGQVMMNHFDAIDSPLKSVEVYKTKEDQRKRFMCSVSVIHVIIQIGIIHLGDLIIQGYSEDFLKTAL